MYHFFRQLWLVLGVKLMEISSNLFSRLFHKFFEGNVHLYTDICPTYLLKIQARQLEVFFSYRLHPYPYPFYHGIHHMSSPCSRNLFGTSSNLIGEGKMLAGKHGMTR